MQTKSIETRVLALLKNILHGEDEDWWSKHGPDVYQECCEIIKALEKN